MLPLILIAAALAILWLLCAFRLARDADDSSDQIARQLAEQGWPHLPRDGSRGYLPAEGATAAMDAPFPRGRDGGRGGFDHAGRG
ncbi:MAG: hypothetical protein ACEQSH_01100 [Bacteroidia bacterium]